MILLHRITHPDHELVVNADQIVTVEANPDTVVSLQNGTRFVVSESTATVVGLVRSWRAGILQEAALLRESLV